MCEKCVEIWNRHKEGLKRWFPEIIDDDAGDILFEYTVFPFDTGNKLEEQIVHLIEVGPVVVKGEIMKEMDGSMDRLRQSSE